MINGAKGDTLKDKPLDKTFNYCSVKRVWET